MNLSELKKCKERGFQIKRTDTVSIETVICVRSTKVNINGEHNMVCELWSTDGEYFGELIRLKEEEK